MTPWATARLAWGAAGLCLVGIVAGLVLTGLSGELDRQFVGQFASFAGVLVAFPAVGALVAARQPRNPVGWQLLAVGVLFSLQVVADAYALYALATAPGSLPGGLVIAWLEALAFAPIVWVLVILLPLYFPTGRLLSPRWRLVAWTGAASMILAIVGNGLLPNTVEVSRIGGGAQPVRGPLRHARSWPAQHLVDSPFAAQRRWCRGRGRGAVPPRQRRGARPAEVVPLRRCAYPAPLRRPRISNALFAFIGPLVPLSVGIAILRYRLYDIDLLITRTVAYGLLTALVTVVYLAIVVGMGALVGSHGRPNLFLSIVATALIAVAFQPARERSRRLANRLVYGKRATPYEILSQFSRGMAGASPTIPCNGWPAWSRRRPAPTRPSCGCGLATCCNPRPAGPGPGRCRNRSRWKAAAWKRP
jgi:hypothetical protein